MQSMLIYTEKITPRLRYIFKVVFEYLIITDYKITHEIDEYNSWIGPKFNYGTSSVDDSSFFASADILWEKGLEGKEISWIKYEDIDVIFPVYQPNSILPFDPLAATFYMISRYEEYMPFVKDEHERFDASQSLLHKKGLLNQPIVNHWLIVFRKKLQSIYPDWDPKSPMYTFIPTYDIDAAWSYKHKGLFRTTGAFIRSIVNTNWNELGQRARVLRGLEQDPFDSFDLMLEWQKEFRLDPVYFILFADYGLNDKNINVRNRHFIQLIKMLGDYAEIGIHPSYNSFNNIKILEKELFSLEDVVHRDVVKSRQHFLRLSLPESYRNLISLDITSDYTMGFASQTGFRAGIGNAYPFYDLDQETITSLMVHPFMVMDGTLRDYLNLEKKDALQLVIDLIQEVRQVNGTFISLWHNESLSDQLRWKGWREVYYSILEEASAI